MIVIDADKLRKDLCDDCEARGDDLSLCGRCDVRRVINSQPEITVNDMVKSGHIPRIACDLYRIIYDILRDPGKSEEYKEEADKIMEDLIGETEEE